MLLSCPMRTDVHQHLWSEPLVEQLASRRELPFVRLERGLTVLYLAGERPYVIDRVGEDPARRAALVERDGLDRALLCLSSPIGIERLCRDQAEPLLEAYHEGALSIREPLGVSLPAGALAGVDELLRMRPVLDRLESRGAPLFVHPGPGIGGPLSAGR